MLILARNRYSQYIVLINIFYWIYSCCEGKRKTTNYKLGNSVSAALTIETNNNILFRIISESIPKALMIIICTNRIRRLRSYTWSFFVWGIQLTPSYWIRVELLENECGIPKLCTSVRSNNDLRLTYHVWQIYIILLYYGVRTTYVQAVQFESTYCHLYLQTVGIDHIKLT